MSSSAEYVGCAHEKFAKSSNSLFCCCYWHLFWAFGTPRCCQSGAWLATDRQHLWAWALLLLVQLQSVRPRLHEGKTPIFPCGWRLIYLKTQFLSQKISKNSGRSGDFWKRWLCVEKHSQHGAFFHTFFFNESHIVCVVSRWKLLEQTSQNITRLTLHWFGFTQGKMVSQSLL